MNKGNAAKPESDLEERKPHRVRLPGFLVEGEIGLGDAIKRVTSAMGIRPCSACEKRAVALNQWITFSRW